MSRVYLGVIERAEKEAGLAVVEKIARGLRVPPHELLRAGGSGEGEVDPAEKLGRKITSLAKDADPVMLAKFEKIATAFFEPADDRMRRKRRER